MKTVPNLLTRRAAVWTSMISCLLLASTASAGDGRFNKQTGEFDFCVCVRFDASAADLDKIRQRFNEAGQIISHATGGQHRFGSVTLINHCDGSDLAEFWIHEARGGAYAPIGQYGKRGQHVNLWFDTYFYEAARLQSGNFCSSPLGLNDYSDQAYSIAHEFAHHAYGLLDEYVDHDGHPAECAGPSTLSDLIDQPNQCAVPNPDHADLCFCLMDNFKCRGEAQSRRGRASLNEFCNQSNHDPDGDTLQSSVRRESCWDTIQHGSYPLATVPTSGTACRAVPTGDGAAGSASVIFLPNWSGSDDQWNLELGQQVALRLIDFASASDLVGALLYPGTGSATTSSIELLPLDSQQRSRLYGFIANTPCTCCPHPGTPGPSTTCEPYPLLTQSLGDAYHQLTNLTAGVPCDSTIVYISLGSEVPPASDEELKNLVSSLKRDRIRVVGVAIGNPKVPGNPILGPTEFWITRLAQETGGDYFPVRNSYDLVRLFARLLFRSVATGLLGRDPGDEHLEPMVDVGPRQRTERTFYVEEAASSLTVAAIFDNTLDHLALSLRTPQGDVIRQGNDRDIQYSSDANSLSFRIAGPISGNWTAIVERGSELHNLFAIVPSIARPMEATTLAGMQLGAVAVDPTITAPEPITIYSNPTCEGQNVVGATVSGLATKPDGSMVQFSFADNGDSPDMVAGDGIYTGTFGYTTDGIYDIRVTAQSEGGPQAAYVGEPIEVVSAPSVINVPRFSRSAPLSVEVRGKCPGDCNTNCQVSMDEVMTGVHELLGSFDGSSCRPLDTGYDGEVTVDELVKAVNSGARGCGECSLD